MVRTITDAVAARMVLARSAGAGASAVTGVAFILPPQVWARRDTLVATGPPIPELTAAPTTKRT
ncbi:hypothetical protein GCM10025762_53370 [Haloechinothrix salitolerans]